MATDLTVRRGPTAGEVPKGPASDEPPPGTPRHGKQPAERGRVTVDLDDEAAFELVMAAAEGHLDGEQIAQRPVIRPS